MKHDRQTAIEEAMNLFWKKGFHATSMRNLQEAIDMRPGSIYASFGSKDGLYKEALLYYRERSFSLLESMREKSDSPMEVLENFFQAVVCGRSSAPSNMCMLVKSVAELTTENEDLLNQTKCILKEVEGEFAKLLTEAIEIGELDGGRDPIRLARWLQMQLMGMRAYVRTNEPEVDIQELIQDIMASVR